MLTNSIKSPPAAAKAAGNAIAHRIQRLDEIVTQPSTGRAAMSMRAPGTRIEACTASVSAANIASSPEKAGRGSPFTASRTAVLKRCGCSQSPSLHSTTLRSISTVTKPQNRSREGEPSPRNTGRR